MTKVYKSMRVIRRIHSDALDRTHEPNEIVDLSDWPKRVIEQWEKRGIVERLSDVKILDMEVKKRGTKG